MTAEVIKGDLFEVEEQYIVHQCNCVTWRGAHLAYHMYSHFPYADIYKPRTGTDKRDEPGTIIIKGDGKEQRYVINLLGQYFPGTPRKNQQALDSFAMRKKYFFNGLQKIAEIEGLTSVAFPWQMGCGAAGGNWAEYHELLDKFSNHLLGVDVKIYRLPGM